MNIIQFSAGPNGTRNLPPPDLQGIAHYWTFGEETGDARWDYVGDAHAMPYAATIPVVETVLGNGVKPDDNTSISAKNISLGGSQSFTIGVWAQTSGNTNDTVIDSQFVGTNHTGGIRILTSSSNVTSFIFRVGTTTSSLPLTYGASAGSELKLYWIAWDAETLTARYAVNDSSWQSTTLSGLLNVTTDLFFGGSGYNRSAAETIIAEAVVWKGYLPSQEERADMYANWRGPEYFNLDPVPPPSPFLDVTLVDMEFLSDAELASAEQGGGTYFLRPYPLHAWDAELASEKGDYVWMRSTDHSQSVDGLFMGFSDSPATPPSAWTLFYDDSALSTASGDTFSQLETPDLTYHPDDPDGKPFYVSAHANAYSLTVLLTGTFGSQLVYQTTHLFKSADLETWEWVGPLLPNSPPDYLPATQDGLYNHTGYMTKTPWGDGTWRAYSLLSDGWGSSYTFANALLEGGGRGSVTHSTGRASRRGWWSSNDGREWTLLKLFDSASPAPSYVLQNGISGFFSMDGQRYAVSEAGAGDYKLARVFKLTEEGDLIYPGWPIENWLASEHDDVWIQGMKIFAEGDTAHIYIKHGYREPNGVIAYYTATLRGELDEV